MHTTNTDTEGAMILDFRISDLRFEILNLVDRKKSETSNLKPQILKICRTGL